MVESRNFCCRQNPSTATKCIAFTDMVVFTFFFIILGTAITIMAVSPKTMDEIFPFREDLDHFMHFNRGHRFYILGALMVWCLGEIGFAILLLCGTKRRSYPMLRAWIFLIIVDCLFGMMAFIPLAALSTQRIIYVVLGVVYYLYRMFSLWIVHTLLREVISQIHWV